MTRGGSDDYGFLGLVVAFIATTVFGSDQSKGGSFGESPNYYGDSPLEQRRVWFRSGSRDFDDGGGEAWR
ncbi:hypothetical protein F3Y22_tig00111721pilonHSYRG00081 [Hibiscus syriacus]|uniref:Uncharacterized protein n=1 Tax=Hibiscus syriacus TaxID=106335 RepID=A0A6A2Y2K2_HIBSY|nr:hypothetical protein F3Y22_tig00111721pilonHSYRG00081 [Hibiscus syriacus]